MWVTYSPGLWNAGSTPCRKVTDYQFRANYPGNASKRGGSILPSSESCLSHREPCNGWGGLTHSESSNKRSKKWWIILKIPTNMSLFASLCHESWTSDLTRTPENRIRFFFAWEKSRKRSWWCLSGGSYTSLSRTTVTQAFNSTSNTKSESSPMTSHKYVQGNRPCPFSN